MRLRSLLVPLLALLPVLVLNGPASGQAASQYPPSAGALVLGTSEVRPGGSLTLSGGGCRPNSTVTLGLRPGPVSLGTVQADAAGNFSTTVFVPAGTAAGLYSVFATCVNPAGGQREVTSVVTVLGVQITRGDALPVTGGVSTIPLGIAGAALVGVGALAVVAGRRKRAGNAVN